MKSFASWLFAGALFGIGVGFLIAVEVMRPAPSPVNPAIADSLRVALADAVRLEEEVARLAAQSRADSIALAASRRRVRIVADSSSPAPDTSIAESGDTVLVYRVPPEVAAHVEKLNRRIVGLEARVTAAELSAIAERKAKDFALKAKADLERALQESERKKWRHRLEGAGVGGIVAALAAIVIAL